MFVRRTNEYPLGIQPHRSIDYAWQSALLRGHVSQPQDKPGIFHLSVEPHLEKLHVLDAAPGIREPKTLKPSFDTARNTTLFLGTYPSLDTIAAYIETLEGFYRAVLSDKGAEHRILRDGQLQLTNQKTENSFGEALKTARDVEVFAALKSGKDLPFEQIVGRVFRSLSQSLGVNYSLREERNPADNSYKSVSFVYEGIGMITFENNGQDEPTGIIRHSYSGGTRGYYPSFAGPATMDNMQRHVFNWLIDAFREIDPQRFESEDDYSSFSDQLRTAESRFYGRMNADQGFRINSDKKVSALRLVK